MSPLIKLQDVLGEASSFVQAIFLAANGLDSADVCAFQVMADEVSARLETARCIIDDLREPTAVTAQDILDAVNAEKARRAALMGDQS